ncbi:MAG: hypothetical protein IJ688_08790 [Treponema sp.]|nr:hypothetical protein [Treponema sp.]
MKKILVISAVLFALGQSLFAFDWGGIVSNTTKPSTSDFSSGSFYQSNGISLWVSHSFNKNLRFTAEGLYRYELNSQADSSTFTNIADLSLLKLSGSWTAGKGNLMLNAGRFSFSDISSVVFNQVSDGLSLAFQTNSIKVSAYAGYTGFVNSLNVSMLDKSSVKQTEFYSLSAEYIPLILDFSLLNLGGTNISLQGEYFVAAKDYLKGKFYGTLSAAGSFGSIASYSLTGVLGSEDFKKFMLYGKGSLAFYLGQNFIASLACDYASGANGSLLAFRTLTTCTAYNGKFNSALSSVIIPQCSAMFVNDNMVISLGEKIILSLPSDKVKFQGFDTSLNFIYNVLSDFQLGSSVIAYKDLIEDANSNFAIALNLALAF